MNDIIQYIREFTVNSGRFLSGLFSGPVQDQVAVLVAVLIIGTLLLLAFHSLSKARTQLHTKSHLLSSIFSFVGTPIHELSHVAFITLSGCRVTKLELFNPKQQGGDILFGSVHYAYPKHPVSLYTLGAVWIGLAPALTASVLALYISFSLFLGNLPLTFGLLLFAWPVLLDSTPSSMDLNIPLRSWILNGFILLALLITFASTIRPILFTFTPLILIAISIAFLYAGLTHILCALLPLPSRSV